MKVLVDARRVTASGIGRVTEMMITDLPRSRPDWEFVLLGDPATLDRDYDSPPNASVLDTVVPLFTIDDFFGVPKVVSHLGPDVFLAPQFIGSPFIAVPAIKMVHDLWPLQQPAWLPSTTAAVDRLGASGVDGVRAFLSWFDDGRPLIDAGLGETLALSEYQQLAPSALRERFVAAMMICALESSTRVLTPSLTTAIELAAFYPSAAHRVAAVPLCSAPRLVKKPGSHRMRASTRTGLSLLHVSRWEPRKNLEFMVSVFKKVVQRSPGSSLTLVGNHGYYDYRLDIEGLLRHADLPNVRDLGEVADDTLRDLYTSADVLVVPSHHEGFGLPLVEAMAHGCVVLAAPVGAIPEVVGNGGILLPHDVGMWDSALAMLESDPSLRANYRKSARRRAADFDVARTMGGWVRCIEEAFSLGVSNPFV